MYEPWTLVRGEPLRSVQRNRTKGMQGSPTGGDGRRLTTSPVRACCSGPCVSATMFPPSPLHGGFLILPLWGEAPTTISQPLHNAHHHWPRAVMGEVTNLVLWHAQKRQFRCTEERRLNASSVRTGLVVEEEIRVP